MNIRRVRIGAAAASLAVVAGLSLPLPALADTVADAAAAAVATAAGQESDWGGVDSQTEQGADATAKEAAPVAEDETTETQDAAEGAAAEDTAAEGATTTEGATQLTEFSAIADGVNVECADDGTVTVTGNGGDQFAVPTESVFSRSFVFEADAKADVSAALAILNAENNPGSAWYAFNFYNRNDGTPRSRFFGNGNNERVTFNDDELTAAGISTTDTVHLKIEMKRTGDYTLTIANAADPSKALSKSGKLESWRGGYLALLAFDSSATFSNIQFTDTTADDVAGTPTGEWGDNQIDSNFITNPKEQMKLYGDGAYSLGDDGSFTMDSTAKRNDMYAVAVDDSLSYGDIQYQATVKFNQRQGCASLVFHSNSDLTDNYSYVANINGATGDCRLFKFGDNCDLAKAVTIDLADDDTYTLSVTEIGKHIVYSVNGQVVINTADYTVDNGDAASNNAHYGQNDALLSGYCGVLTYSGNVTYSGIDVTPLNDETTPQLKSLDLAGDNVDMGFSFQSDQYVYIGYVSNDSQTASVSYETFSPNAKVTVTDSDGKVCDASSLPVPNEGENLYTMTVVNGDATVIYKLRIFRSQPSDTYYNEDWRDQYHFSVKDGWGNDPCGLVYYQGVYHFFYQYYTDTVWGPMHWGHATSTDLIHWEQQPIALYPDEYGAMYSGCAVVADHSTAPSIFADGESGIVLLVTGNGRNGSDNQRIVQIYSKDGGVTWQQNEDAGVLIDNTTDDPLYNAALRDPKVFRYDNKWFMVVAGGPLRIYSSDDLVTWKCEAAHQDLNTECPDLYPVQTDDGTIKWILDRGGRLYQVGAFGKQADGHYDFVQDPGTTDYTMNFGPDSYAAMTYFMAGEDFGTSENPKAPEKIAVNWMNTWDDYCNLVSGATGNDVFCGTYNLFTEQSLVKQDDGTYRLAQTPISQYEALRDTDSAVTLKDETVDGTSDALSGFSGNSYEIVANIKPREGTPVVGFDVHVGNGQKTRVSYDFSTQTMTIDRSQSGVIVSSKFGQNCSQSQVEPNADGSVDLHIYVDRMSVEAFTADYTVAGAVQVFPSPLSDGLDVFSEGGASTVNATVYQLDSIWDQAEQAPTTPQGIGLSQSSARLYAGDSVDVTAWVSPASAPQDLVVSSSDEGVATVEQTDGGVRVTGTGSGKATITIASKSDPSVSKTFEVTVTEYAFKTNVEGMDATGGDFYADGEAMRVNTTTNSFLVSSDKYNTTDMTYTVDVAYKDGTPNLVFGSQTTDPFAGCYAVQLGGADKKVRLFNFLGDHTYIEGDTAQLDENDVYHVVITCKQADQADANARSADAPLTITVTVNDKQVLTYTTSGDDPVYTEGYVALGIYSAHETSFANFYVDAEKVDEGAEQPGGDDDQVSKDDLQQAIDDAAGLNEGDYTADSWKAFQDALAAAQAVLTDENATADQIAAAQQSLADAIAGLQKADQGNTGNTGDEGQGGSEQPGSGTENPGSDQGNGGNAGGSDQGNGGTAGGSDQGGSTSGSGNGSNAASGSNGGGSVSKGGLPTTGDVAAIAAGVSALAGAGALTGAAVLRRRKRR